MNKIINGKRYNTETAELIGECTNTFNYSDFNYECEKLYRKKTGEFFLYGEGGPMTSYAVYSGNNNWSGGSKIRPFSIEEAKKWGEENLDGDTYEKIFELEEEGNIAFSVLLPENLYDRLKYRSGETGETMKDIIVKALEGELK